MTSQQSERHKLLAAEVARKTDFSVQSVHFLAVQLVVNPEVET